jgi:uncharacterized protein (DUF2252 family)
MLHGRRGLVAHSLENYNANLTDKEKEEKYCKMAASPYSFYRGSNHLFWEDFEWDWRMTRFGNYRTRTWLNGDCHAYNFGAYHPHDIGVIYGLNDFDESIIADYQYDLWRLAISLVLIPNEAPAPAKSGKEPVQFPKLKIKDVIGALCDGYLKTLSLFDGNRDADKTSYSRQNTYGPLQKFLKKVKKGESREMLLEEWTMLVDGQLLFNRDNPDVAELPTDVYKLIESNIPAYVETLGGDIDFPDGFFKVNDIVGRLNAGTGSLGSNRYYVLVEGDPASNKDNVILDVKEQSEPSAYLFATQAQKDLYKKAFPHEGIRYVEAYRALDYHPDDHLGWMKLENMYYGVRERNPYKKSFKTNKDIKTKKDYIEMAAQWGTILATEHSRAEKVNPYSLGGEVKQLTKGKTKAFKQAVQEVALGYAEVVNADYDLFIKHIAPAKEGG